MNKKEAPPTFTKYCFIIAIIFLVVGLFLSFFNTPINDAIFPLVSLTLMLLGHLSDTRYYW
jgi:preprotein translocase subunit SecG